MRQGERPGARLGRSGRSLRMGAVR